MHSGAVTKYPGAQYPESEDAIPTTKEEQSMADLLQQTAQSSSPGAGQPQPKEELDLAAPTPELKIPDYENYSHVEPIATPKAPACPPQMGVPLQEPVATKRQASDDAPIQAPPNQFLAPEEQQPTGEQRPDPAKKARPPSPPGELRARTEREWLIFSAHER